jgi:hypothetical protein
VTPAQVYADLVNAWRTDQLPSEVATRHNTTRQTIAEFYSLQYQHTETALSHARRLAIDITHGRDL